MNDSRRPGTLDCAAAREAIHEILDREPVGEGQEELQAHLAGCSGCRELRADHEAIQQALFRIPARALPDRALDEVWSRTTRANRGSTLGGWGFDWRFAAAAAVVVAAVFGIWLYGTAPGTGGPGGPAGPTDAELQQAARQTRMVLKYTAEALRKAERVALRDVLEGQVSSALRRAPIDWSGPGATRGGSGT